MDGVETIRKIRSEFGAGIPILLTSAYDQSDIEDEVKGAGASGFISKPLFRSRLYEKINEVLGKEATAVEPEDDYSDLAGINILVAEDNEINWEILSAMLGMFGITTERAENGRICVDKMAAAKEGSYDLIFMDVQMPEMKNIRRSMIIWRTFRIPDWAWSWTASVPAC